jgi:DNA invertase Pin-like site-specific DNA recombinase
MTERKDDMNNNWQGKGFTHDPGKEANRNHAAIYARTATSQVKENFALERQIAACRVYCQKHGYSVEEGHIYSEECSGIEGYQKRLQLGEVLRLATTAKRENQTPPFEKLIVISLDRLSRDYVQQTAIIQELNLQGVIVESLDGYGPDVTMFMQTVKQEIAQIERDQLIRRVKLGKRTACDAKGLDEQ